MKKTIYLSILIAFVSGCYQQSEQSTSSATNPPAKENQIQDDKTAAALKYNATPQSKAGTTAELGK